jgi:hypothetical protein
LYYTGAREVLTTRSLQGAILTNHEAEVVLKDAAPEVVFIRGVYFMENWGMGLETLPAGFFYTTVTPVDHPLPMVSLLCLGWERTR